jgi:hypothetical protein
MAETTTVTPTEVAFSLRLKQGRFLLRIGDQLGDMQARLDRVSKYVVKRLQRRYPSLAVSRPVWSVDRDPSLSPQLQRRAYCFFDYIDMSPYTDQPGLAILPPATVEVVGAPNRAQRRAGA